eukprot:scaffold1112_cov92-Amphora_coffeaeformis.AAC.5
MPVEQFGLIIMVLVDVAIVCLYPVFVAVFRLRAVLKHQIKQNGTGRCDDNTRGPWRLLTKKVVVFAFWYEISNGCASSWGWIGISQMKCKISNLRLVYQTCQH